MKVKDLEKMQCVSKTKGHKKKTYMRTEMQTCLHVIMYVFCIND